MNNNLLSPYIRVARLSILPKRYHLAKRVIYDYELIYVQNGSAKLIIDDMEFILRKNEVIFLRPGISHVLTYHGDQEFDQPHIHFDLIYNKNSERTPICFQDKSSMTDEQLSLIQEDILDANIPFVFTPYDSKAFGDLFFDIITLYVNRPVRYELTAKIKMLELLSLIFEQFDVKGTTGEDSSVNDPAVMVKNYIDNNYLHLITLKTLENQFFVNKYTLIRNFNRLYKKSPVAYYHELRLEHAKEMLTETGLSISRIAEKMNFPDSYSFNRFFRSHMGLPPSEYRAQTQTYESTTYKKYLERLNK